jgi:hypothetical protein
MFMDALLLFSSAQAITADAASTNIVDLGNARDMGVGSPIQISVTVATAFATTNAGTLDIQFQGSTDGTTWNTYGSSTALAAAALTAGRRLGFNWPTAQGYSNPRYVRLYYDVTNAFTGGAITAGAVLDRQQDAYYPAGITISN